MVNTELFKFFISAKLINLKSVVNNSKFDVTNLLCDDLILKDIYIVYSTTDDFRNSNPEMIVQVLKQNTFNFDLINDTLNELERTKFKFSDKSSDIKKCIALVQGASIHIISINQLNPINL